MALEASAIQQLRHTYEQTEKHIQWLTTPTTFLHATATSPWDTHSLCCLFLFFFFPERNALWKKIKNNKAKLLGSLRQIWKHLSCDLNFLWGFKVLRDESKQRVTGCHVSNHAAIWHRRFPAAVTGSLLECWDEFSTSATFCYFGKWI